jgi:hypothetical protein
MNTGSNRRRLSCSVAAAALWVALAVPARAQYFSKDDGFTTDGRWQVQTELMPYLWLPATSGALHFGNPRGSTVDFNSAVPSASTLAHTLRGAFMGSGLVRYGPFSAEFDLDYISVNESQDVPAVTAGRTNRVNVSASLVRFAPGLGLEAYRGEIGGVQTIIDVRAGFAFFASEQAIKGEGDLAGRGHSGNDSSIQPWLGARATFIPSPRWRVMINAIYQGMGVDGGSQGWGATAIASYAVTDWMDVSLGFRALETTRGKGPGDLPGSDRRSFSILAYGPLLGVGFRF